MSANTQGRATAIKEKKTTSKTSKTASKMSPLVLQEEVELGGDNSNDLTPNNAIVITSDGKNPIRANKLQKIRSMWRQDDFSDFDHPIRVVQGGAGELERLEIPALQILNFFMGGGEKNLSFSLEPFLVIRTRYFLSGSFLNSKEKSTSLNLNLPKNLTLLACQKGSG